MKIVLVNPPITKQERYGSLAPAGSYVPPLALCSLGALTRSLGYETAVIDSQVEGLDHAATIERIAAGKPDVVGITSTTSTFSSAARLAKMIKEDRNGTTVVAGGVHVSALPERCLRDHPSIDVGVVGEGEETVAELMAALKGRTPLDGIRGLALRRNGGVVLTPDRPLMKDLDSLPLPAWDLLPDFPAAYNVQAQSVSHFPSTSCCTSRGCTGRCKFCDRRIFGRALRAHGADYVMRMIRELYDRYGIRDIQFEDDNFMLFRKRLLEICDRLVREKLDISWSCQARVDMVMPETLQKMKEAGCWMILYGVESGSQKVLDAMDKQITVEKIERAIEMTHKAGIGCKGFFIAGYLSEDRESLKETYDFIRRCKLDDVSFHYFTPFPGSASYDVATEHGAQRGGFDDMTYYRPVFVPRGLTEQDLIRHTKACYRRFYSRPRTILTYLKRIRSPSHLLFFARSSVALAKYLVSKKE